MKSVERIMMKLIYNIIKSCMVLHNKVMVDLMMMMMMMMMMMTMILST